MTAKLNLLYTSADILAAVKISDNPEIMGLHELPEEHQAFIEGARRRGAQPVSARWPGGQFAILFCEPGTDLPSVANILRAYRACLNTSKQFPEGETA
jgi:hypothetical protein